MAILVTGGTGYIGSHTVVELLNKNKEVVVLDNFVNSSPEVIQKIKQITGKDFKFYEVDLLDKENLTKVFEENSITEVIHFAGLKAVGESIQKPLEYYTNNIVGTLVLLEVMRKYNCKKIVFSSSATVYGDQGAKAYSEKLKRGETTNPYGTTKSMIEKILEDLYVSDNEWGIIILRYFNPVGAHESGLIGDNPNGIPNNLMPYIQKVAMGELPELSIFGNDYNTKDGTCIRDFIHVIDLSLGHINALEKINKENTGIYIYNLGTGVGYSVLDMVTTFKNVNNIEVPYKMAERRAGDLPDFYADPTKAKKELGWTATKTLEDMCRDSWNFAKMSK
jgi:UDP-glucose 4-epimerase